MTEFGPQALAQLREMARRVLREEVGRNTVGGTTRNWSGPYAAYVLKSSTAGITGRSTNTPGSGTATIYYRSTGNTLTATTSSVTIYNMTTGAVAASKYIQAKQDIYGVLWVDVEACT